MLFLATVRFFALLAALRFGAALLFVALLAVLRLAVLLRAVDFLARVAGLAELLPAASSDHFPDITRCAASATASAINAPSLLALDMTLVAAAEALSAASRPASRILRRAAGLALIAAAGRGTFVKRAVAEPPPERPAT